MQVRFANQRTATLRSKETRRDAEVTIASQLSIAFRASVVIKRANMVHGCKDKRVNRNSEWGGMGYAMVKSDTEILRSVPWLILKKKMLKIREHAEQSCKSN